MDTRELRVNYPPAAEPMASTQSCEPDLMRVTALLLNWKRPDNLSVIIDRLRAQDIPVTIFLWNNNNLNQTNYPVDMQINSSQNLFCWPRWLMAGMVKDRYCFSLDDDFAPVYEDTLRQCCQYLTDRPDVDMMGYCGVKLRPDLNYWLSEHFKHPDPQQDKLVDIIKGRFIFARTSFFSTVPLLSRTRRCDDIVVSSCAKKKVLPSFMEGQMEDLPAGDVGLEKNPTHKDIRDRETKLYFSGSDAHYNKKQIP